ncbi:FtsX-like permease family protein [Nonomuraea sp. NBC_01738]|uniref:ABC transporter permease n=1 Tax=Nonomuraea sp. NBC_01738 TaxID=2976003 RepID=UPI002E11690A|nr:FtsX-like permease family protein [Nonomuraea sp. NBC_01738]
MSAFLAAFRISRRDALRFKGRTALIMIMIGLPVMAITGVLTGRDTAEVSALEGLTARLGVADAQIMTTNLVGPLHQSPDGDQYITSGKNFERDVTWTDAQIAALVKGRLIPYNKGTAEIGMDNGYEPADALEIDLRDPMTTGMRTLVEGRLPAALGEVVVSPALRDLGMRVGRTVGATRLNRPVKVVGVVRHERRPGLREIIGLRGQLLLDRFNGVSWLADTGGVFTWAQVKTLNRQGLRVHARAIVENPPAAARFDGALPRAQRLDAVVTVVTTVAMVVLETILLAGPAFAVGLRRRRRELAVIAAQGGSARHLRAIVLTDGLVLGGLASLVGAALGITVALVAVPLLSDMLSYAGPPDIPWPKVAAAAGLGVLSGVVAALVPAIQAARQDTARILAGRGDTTPSTGRRRLWWPLLGACWPWPVWRPRSSGASGPRSSCWSPR